MKKFLRLMQIITAYTFIASLIAPLVLFALNDRNTINEDLITGLVIAFWTASISFALNEALNKVIGK